MEDTEVAPSQHTRIPQSCPEGHHRPRLSRSATPPCPPACARHLHRQQNPSVWLGRLRRSSHLDLRLRTWQWHFSEPRGSMPSLGPAKTGVPGESLRAEVRPDGVAVMCTGRRPRGLEGRVTREGGCVLQTWSGSRSIKSERRVILTAESTSEPWDRRSGSCGDVVPTRMVMGAAVEHERETSANVYVPSAGRAAQV